jgi:hypothetical protein
MRRTPQIENCKNSEKQDFEKQILMEIARCVKRLLLVNMRANRHSRGKVSGKINVNAVDS